MLAGRGPVPGLIFLARFDQGRFGVVEVPFRVRDPLDMGGPLFVRRVRRQGVDDAGLDLLRVRGPVRALQAQGDQLKAQGVRFGLVVSDRVISG